MLWLCPQNEIQHEIRHDKKANPLTPLIILLRKTDKFVTLAKIYRQLNVT